MCTKDQATLRFLQTTVKRLEALLERSDCINDWIVVRQRLNAARERLAMFEAEVPELA